MFSTLALKVVVSPSFRVLGEMVRLFAVTLKSGTSVVWAATVETEKKRIMIKRIAATSGKQVFIVDQSSCFI
jgi:predicted kinase